MRRYNVWNGMWLGGALALIGGVLACNDEGVNLIPSEVAPDGYWSLTLDHEAITLSTNQGSPAYNTVQLTATPRTADGTAITTLEAPTFRLRALSDTTRVRLTPSGLVTARAATGASSPVQVIASLSNPAQGITLADTAFILVTAAVRPIKTFTIAPLPGDSTRVAVGWDKSLAARITDSSDVVVLPTAIRILYTSSDRKIAAIDSLTGVIEPRNPGTVTFTATTLSYGVAKSSQVTYTVTMPPLVFNVYVIPGQGISRLDPASVTIKKGQGISWRPLLAAANIVFDPADVPNVKPGPLGGAGGNIPVFFTGRQTRLFPVPGTYRYREASTNIQGTIIVEN